jgi:integrase
MDKLHLRWIHPHFFGRALADLDQEAIAQLREARLKTGVSNATVNRMLEVVRAVLNRAQKEWEWIDRVPHIRMLQEADERVRWLTDEEIARLLGELPPHLEAMARFTLATGLRMSNVTQLKWQDVDLERRCAWVWAKDAKGRRSFSVPLSDAALETLHQENGKHATFVFTYQGRPVTRSNNHAWRKALRRAGIEDFRWHDLRHCWATRHVQAGTPLHVLQKLGAWSDYEMVLKYAHLSPDYLAEHAEPGANLVKPKR